MLLNLTDFLVIWSQISEKILSNKFPETFRFSRCYQFKLFLFRHSRRKKKIPSPRGQSYEEFYLCQFKARRNKLDRFGLSFKAKFEPPLVVRNRTCRKAKLIMVNRQLTEVEFFIELSPVWWQTNARNCCQKSRKQGDNP